MEDDEDVHLCLRCNAKITGLDNYVAHRKQNCMRLAKNVREIAKPPSEKNSVLETQVNDFFTSLELQSTAHLPKNKRGDGIDEEETPMFSDEDEYVPPRSHTGGKWTPGTRPELTNEQSCITGPLPVSATNVTTAGRGKDVDKPKLTSYECKTCERKFQNNNALQKHFQTTYHRKRNVGHESEDVGKILEERNDVRTCKSSYPNCQLCCKTFESKKDYAMHQFSLKHRKKFSNENSWLEEVHHFQTSVINYCFPYRCSICGSFYLYYEQLEHHVKSVQHQQKVTSLWKPHFCLPCKFECRASDEMIGHFTSMAHKLIAREELQNHPIIVVSKSCKLDCSCPNDNCILLKSNAITDGQQPNLVSEKRTKIQTDHKYATISSSDVVHKCSECEKSFKTICEHDDHFKIEHSQPFCCTPCNTVFLAKKLLYHHLKTTRHKMRIKHSQSTGTSSTSNDTYNCTVCKFKTSSQGEFSVHEVQHSKAIDSGKKNKSRKAFRCPYCSKVCFLSQLRQHILSHTKERPFACSVCSKKFSQNGSLKVHMRLHLGLKIFQCNHCNFKSEHKKVLLKHENTHKTVRPRSFLCDVCGSSYLDRTALWQHMKTHSELKYKCKHLGCSYSSRAPSELLIHERVHTKDTPYLCDTCGHAVKSQNQLRKHQRQHTGEKPFQCPHCSYSATLSSNIVRHLRVHSGIKPYKCPYCNYTCNTQENIRKHILKTKKHAGKSVYPCKHCDFGCNDFQKYKLHFLENHKELLTGAEKDIESAVITGLKVKETPSEILPYTPRPKKKTVSHKISSDEFVDAPTVVRNNTMHQPSEDMDAAETAASVYNIPPRTDVLSALTPMILGHDEEVETEVTVISELIDVNVEKDDPPSELTFIENTEGELYNTIFIYVPVTVA